MPEQSAQLFGQFVLDLASGELWWSESMFAVYGVRWDNPICTDLLLSRIEPDDRAAAQAELERASESPGPVSGQYRFYTDSGAEKVIAYIGDVERATDGSPSLRLSGYAMDITEEARRAGTRAVRAATRSRKSIEQVKGALMATYGVDEATAFDVLVGYSTRHNVKVAVLAAGVAGRLGPELRQSEDLRGTLLRLLEEVATGTVPSMLPAAPQSLDPAG